MIKQTALILALAATSGSTLAASQQTDAVAPELGQGVQREWPDAPVVAQKFMLSAANPVAANVGYEILKQGGNAIDAMVAVQAVLGLVEPQSSGLGGGAFMLYHDASSGRLTSFDARETAPLAATPSLFQDEQGQPLKFFDAVVGGRSVGTPGTPKLMYELHQAHGSLNWESLLQPAINLAHNGFVVSARLADSIAGDADRLATYPDTRAYFFNEDGTPLVQGHILKNPDYADTLRQFAREGDSAFYQGSVGMALVDKVRSITDNPGVLQMIDLQSYRLKERPAICVNYRVYDVCGMGPPSSGALTVGQILGMLNNFDLTALGDTSPKAWNLIGEASRLAFADRGRYMADSDFVPMPAGLVDTAYLQQRAALIEPGKALESVSAGEPNWGAGLAFKYGDDQAIELPSTTHFSIVDAQGNVLSMTSTIENGFGSRVMSGGFLLNNELTDFSFKSYDQGYPIANRVEPGKRPRSSMSPTIVMRDNAPYMAIGSPGGSRIIGYVVNALVAHIDWGKDIQAAINQPHRVNRFGTFDLEQNTQATELQSDLEAMGYKVSLRDLNSGIHAIVIGESQLEGGADPRREGVVLGD